MAVCTHQPPRLEPSKRAAITIFVVGLHLLLLYLFALMRGADPAQPLQLPAMNIQLFRSGGGGAASEADIPRTRDRSTPSAIHVPDRILPWTDTPPAPPEALPPQALVGAGEAQTPVSEPRAAEVAASGANGAGESGGGGTGAGAGVGSGAGSGSGDGGASGAVLIRAPRGAVMSRNVSPTALAALPGSWAVLRCEIRLNQRLDRCRVLAEHPVGSGVRERAFERAREVRFTPPSRRGRFRDSARVTFAFHFPPDPVEPNNPQDVDGN